MNSSESPAARSVNNGVVCSLLAPSARGTAPYATLGAAHDRARSDADVGAVLLVLALYLNGISA